MDGEVARVIELARKSVSVDSPRFGCGNQRSHAGCSTVDTYLDCATYAKTRNNDAHQHNARISTKVPTWEHARHIS